MCDDHGGSGSTTRRRFLGGAAVLGALAATGLRSTAAAAAAAPAGAVEVAPGLAIVPRSAWGGDLPPQGPLVEEEVRFLLVHHSAGSNTYSAGAVPGILRDIYGFHTAGRGWPDVAYGFLVDRFGGVWEGRTGSLERAVRADATGGNQGFAALGCYLGEFTGQLPTAEAEASMIRLLAWLADRHGVDTAPGTRTSFVSRGSNRHRAGATVVTPTIAGHRDMSLTSCPGDALYGRVVNDYQALVTAARRPTVTAGVATVDGRGLWLADAAGAVTALEAPFHGDLRDLRLNQPVVGMAATPGGGGYWLVAADGGIFAFGDAVFHGSTGSLVLNQPVVGMAATPSGLGYWLVATDGGIFAFGNAPFYGSTGSMRLNRPVVGISVPPAARGYRLVAADGGVFAFGEAPFLGSLGSAPPADDVVSLAPVHEGDGYWLLDRSGRVYAFGAARHLGDAAPTPSPAVLLIANPAAAGYVIVLADGRRLRFGAAPGPA